jgi:AcrR family transcriptional regulator
VSPRPRLSQHETLAHRRELIEATFRVIAASGDPDPSVRRILSEARLSRQAFYRCFPSKDELIVAMRLEGRRLLAEYLAARIARAPTYEAKVQAWVAGVMRQAEVKRAAARTRPFVISLGRAAGDNPGEFSESQRVLCQPLEEVIAAGVADGIWTTADPKGDALIIYDFVLGSLRRHLVLGTPPSSETPRALADFALRAITAPARKLGLGPSPYAVGSADMSGVLR